jgi:hypothetical protein
MYTTYSGGASLLFKKIYKNSDKHVTLLLEMALDRPLAFGNQFQELNIHS